jgi:hypothetical protein
MTSFKISFLIPGYLPPGRLVEPETAENNSQATVAMQWQTGLIQQPWQANFEQHLGLSEASGLHLPAARLLSEGQSDSSGIVCADPIHLQADRDTAKLLPAEMLNITDEEADGLLKDINEFLKADDFTLFRIKDRGWFLLGMDASSLASFPPSFLANRNASAYMPEGEGSGQWRRLMTELQMLLHAHPINERREQLGKLPINSLWFWGGAAPYSEEGVLEDSAESASTPIGTVFADDEFSRAACAQFQVPCRSLNEFDPMHCENALVVDTRIAKAIFARDESGMHRVIEQINQGWLEPISQRINSGEVQELLIVNEDGDRGALTKEMLLAQARSENPLAGILSKLRVPEQLKRWFNGTKQG